MKKSIAMILCCLLLTGCEKVSTGGTVPTRVATAPVETIETTAPVETTAPGYTLALYAPNEDATGFVYSTWELSELSPSTLCDAFIEVGVLQEGVAFNSLQVEGSQVLLDVNAAFGQLIGSYGTAGEYMIMGSVVNTLLSAYNAETVLITMDGQILESGHAIYDFPLGFFENNG